METSHSCDSLVAAALSVLSGDLGVEILVGFSTQVSFLKVLCNNCFLDCHGCIDNCPHPESWPETTLLNSPTNDKVIFEGCAIGAGKDVGKVAGYLIVRDAQFNKVYSEPCVLTLPWDN
jgi:hypothetical protein